MRGSGVAESRSSTREIRHGIGATPGERDARLAADLRHGDADLRERPALSVHRLEVDALWSVRQLDLEDQFAGLERRRAAVVLVGEAVQLLDRELAPVRRSRAPSAMSAAATSDGCADAQKSFAKIACSRCSPSRAWQRSPPWRRQL